MRVASCITGKFCMIGWPLERAEQREERRDKKRDKSLILFFFFGLTNWVRCYPVGGGRKWDSAAEFACASPIQTKILEMDALPCTPSMKEAMAVTTRTDQYRYLARDCRLMPQSLPAGEKPFWRHPRCPRALFLLRTCALALGRKPRRLRALQRRISKRCRPPSKKYKSNRNTQLVIFRTRHDGQPPPARRKGYCDPY